MFFYIQKFTFCAFFLSLCEILNKFLFYASILTKSCKYIQVWYFLLLFKEHGSVSYNTWYLSLCCSGLLIFWYYITLLSHICCSYMLLIPTKWYVAKVFVRFRQSTRASLHFLWLIPFWPTCPIKQMLCLKHWKSRQSCHLFGIF